MFHKHVDVHSREDMLHFLRSHERCDAPLPCYANDVSVRRLRLTQDQMTVALAMAHGDQDYWPEISGPITMFTKKWGGKYAVFRVGCHSRYLALHSSEFWGEEHRIIVDDGTFYHPAHINEWPDEKIRYQVRVVRSFDRACDQVRDLFVDLVNQKLGLARSA